MSLLSTRPAESATVAGSLAVLASYFLGVEEESVLLALIAVIGAIPGVVTWIVELRRARVVQH